MQEKRKPRFTGEQLYHIFIYVVLAVLASYRLTGHRVAGAPGIYVRLHAAPSSPAALEAPHTPQQAFAGLGKIAALGLKVHQGCSYHGVALNVAMDLHPYLRINPCGYAGLRTVDMASCGVQADVAQVQSVLAAQLQRWLA